MHSNLPRIIYRPLRSASNLSRSKSCSNTLRADHLFLVLCCEVHFGRRRPSLTLPHYDMIVNTTRPRGVISCLSSGIFSPFSMGTRKTPPTLAFFCPKMPHCITFSPVINVFFIWNGLLHLRLLAYRPPL